MRRILLFLICTACGISLSAQTSPNGKLKAEKFNDHITVSYKQNGAWQEIYTAEFDGISGGDTRSIKEDYRMLTGKRLHCVNKGKESVYSLRSGGVLYVRIYNDGVAFRKVGRASMNDKAETPVALTIPYYINSWIMNWSDGAEGFFPKNRQMKQGDRLSFPALFEFPNNVFALLSEADIRHDQAASSFYSLDGKNKFNIVHDQNEQSDFAIYGEGLDTYSYYAPVHVPENATSMTVKAEVVAAHQVSGNNVVFSGGHSFAAGETVSFTVAVPAGQKIDQVTATDANGTNVPVTMDGTYGTFTMPDADVTVTVTFKEIDPSEQVTITAIYDEDQYRVYSQSEAYYGSITSDGITVPTGTTLYISIQDDYGEPFWVGVKIGDDVQYIQAQEDEDTGEYTFGRSFVFSANSVIKVGASQNAVAF